MSITVENIVEAFELLYAGILKKDFRKTLELNKWGERDLLPLVRAFLLGYFGESLVPEAEAELPICLSGRGRFDFLIGNVAVEFVVRKPYAPKRDILPIANKSEVVKLTRYSGKSVLVLFDFSYSPLTSEELDSYRNLPSLGSGNFNVYPFNLIYYYIGSGKNKSGDFIMKNIRV